MLHAAAALLAALVLGGSAAAVTPPTSVCARCHEAESALASQGGHSVTLACEDCHTDRRPNRVGRRHRATRACAECHDLPGHPKPALRGRAATDACMACHEPHGSPNLALVGPDIRRPRRRRPAEVTFVTAEGAAPGGFTDPAHPGDGLCEVCHRKTDVYTATGRGAPHFTEPCDVCHPHEAAFRPVASDASCGICHAAEATRLALPSEHMARFACGACHAEVAPAPGPGHRTATPCGDCHANATHAPGGAAMPCTRCHDPHGTTNENLVLEAITTPSGTAAPIVFRDLAGRADGSFAAASAPGTGVCEVCHTTTRFYRADGGGEPHFTVSCLPCHRHSTGFAPQ
jgi:predicted CXXCH cytochrome family protein